MTWEYKLVVKDMRLCVMTTQELNNLGHQGWELVDKTKNEHTSEFIFKRPMKCENCKHYKRSFTVCYGHGFTLKNENCMRDPNIIKCVKADNDGCEHFKSKDND